MANFEVLIADVAHVLKISYKGIVQEQVTGLLASSRFDRGEFRNYAI